MKKKVLSLLLSGTLTVCTMCACGIVGVPIDTANQEMPVKPKNGNTLEGHIEYPWEDDSHIIKTTGPIMFSSEPLPEECFKQITFDSANAQTEGYFAVVPAENTEGETTGGTLYKPVEESNVFQYAQGPVGEALYLDGSFGLDLNLEATHTDTYTISFWMNADAVDMETIALRLGYHMDEPEDAGNNVTWLQIGMSEEYGRWTRMFPAAFSRNEASDAADGTDCLPWMSAFDSKIRGEKEWVMVTIVATGEAQDGPAGTKTIGACYYINNAMVFDSVTNYEYDAYFEHTWDGSLAPNIMTPGQAEFESLFGITGERISFQGFVDNLYIYDTALTGGQVSSLYSLGNPEVKSIIQ